MVLSKWHLRLIGFLEFVLGLLAHGPARIPVLTTGLMLLTLSYCLKE